MNRGRSRRSGPKEWPVIQLQSSREEKRTFTLLNELHFRGPNILEELLDSLKADTFEVLAQGADDAALTWPESPDEDVDLAAGLSVREKILDWLPVGVQRVYWRPDIEKGNLATYENNLLEVICPRRYKPHGPACFCGRIAVSTKVMKFSRDAVKGVLAHELVHVLRCLRIIVPAFVDWGEFLHNWRINMDVVEEYLREVNRPIDSYGEKTELSEIQEFWPHELAEQWFKALRGGNKS